ncbi:MAG: hypothetical protein NUV81_01010 [bacterium]|nr:hypothetical protein [bacterium]
MILLKRFLFHVTASATTLFLILSIGEWLVPGSVLPFFNVVDAILPLFGLILVCVLICSKPSPPEHANDSLS